MYTDQEIEFLFLGRPLDGSGNGNGASGNGKKKPEYSSVLIEPDEYTEEQVEQLVLGLLMN